MSGLVPPPLAPGGDDGCSDARSSGSRISPPRADPLKAARHHEGRHVRETARRARPQSPPPKQAHGGEGDRRPPAVTVGVTCRRRGLPSSGGREEVRRHEPARGFLRRLAEVGGDALEAAVPMTVCSKAARREGGEHYADDEGTADPAPASWARRPGVASRGRIVAVAQLALSPFLRAGGTGIRLPAVRVSDRVSIVDVGGLAHSWRGGPLRRSVLILGTEPCGGILCDARPAGAALLVSGRPPGIHPGAPSRRSSWSARMCSRR